MGLTCVGWLLNRISWCRSRMIGGPRRFLGLKGMSSGGSRAHALSFGSLGILGGCISGPLTRSECTVAPGCRRGAGWTRRGKLIRLSGGSRAGDRGPCGKYLLTFFLGFFFNFFEYWKG